MDLLKFYNKWFLFISLVFIFFVRLQLHKTLFLAFIYTHHLDLDFLQHKPFHPIFPTLSSIFLHIIKSNISFKKNQLIVGNGFLSSMQILCLFPMLMIPTKEGVEQRDVYMGFHPTKFTTSSYHSLITRGLWFKSWLGSKGGFYFQTYNHNPTKSLQKSSFDPSTTHLHAGYIDELDIMNVTVIRLFYRIILQLGFTIML